MGKSWGTMIRRIPGGRWLALAALFALLATADFLWLDATKIIDQRGGDVLLALNAQRRPESDKVVIVDIDQKSLEEMNDVESVGAGSWPWPRSVHGELIEHIAAQKPQAIVFDILFNEPDTFRPEHDAAFAEAVAAHPNVWLAMTLNSDGTGAVVSELPATVGAQPVGQPRAGARVPIMLPLVVADHPEAMRGGLINFTPDTDGVGRHHLLYAERNGWRFPSLAARIVTAAKRPLPGGEQVLLSWRSSWQHVSYSDLYLDSLREHSQRLPDEFKGKIVVIGTAAPGLMDFRVSPLANTYPGVEILATALDNLTRGDWLREVSRRAMLPLALALIVLLALGFARHVSPQRLLMAMIAATLLAIGASWLLLIGGTFVPVLGALTFGWAYYLVASGLAYLDERARRLRTANLFSRFLDARVVAELIDKGEIDFRQQAEAREISVLFSDIRGFTALSEVSAPEAVVAMLNGYFSRQVGVIFSHGGTLDKFIGDAIMAFWGAPAAQEDHAARAVNAALAMSAALEDMRGQLGEIGAELEIGIGIHSGSAVVGLIGSADRLDYTAIGDTVNLASRVEGLTKGMARVLATEATKNAAGDAFAWRDCGVHAVKGRELGVRLFEPSRKAASL